MYDVEVTKTRDEAKGQNNWGKTLLGKCKIYLDDDICQSRREETFIHEILHLCTNQAGLDLEFKQEENIVNAISNALYPILKENKLLK
mgnify:CR=1 FL=1